NVLPPAPSLATTIETPRTKRDAGVVMDDVQSVLQDTAYVGPGAHGTLWNNLKDLRLIAGTVLNDNGDDPAVTAMNSTTFYAALRTAINRAVIIGNRERETMDVRDKSRQLAARLQGILRQ